MQRCWKVKNGLQWLNGMLCKKKGSKIAPSHDKKEKRLTYFVID